MKEPKDTEDRMYIRSYSCDLEELLERVTDKWGNDTKLSDITVSSREIQTDCFGYDAYDSADYTNYIILEKR